MAAVVLSIIANVNINARGRNPYGTNMKNQLRAGRNPYGISLLLPNELK